MRATGLSATSGIFVFTFLALCGSLALAQPIPANRDAELDTRRLTGKAYYENDKFTEAADEFRRCIELAPEAAVDYFNLGLIFMRASKYDEAQTALHQAREHDPNLIGALYLQGIVYKRQGKYEQAIESLKQVIAKDSQCMGAYYNLGVCYKFLQKYEESVEAFKGAISISPQHPSSHYQLITLYRRLGQVDNAKRHREIFDLVKDTVDESEKTVEALERSKYSYILDTPRITEGLTPNLSAKVKFVEWTTRSGLPEPGKVKVFHGGRPILDMAAHQRDSYLEQFGGAVVVADYDSDGDLDIYFVNCAQKYEEQAANVLYQNDGKGHFTDVTENAGVGDGGHGMDAIFGDYDNDGHNDIYVVNVGPNVLYRNNGDGTFEDVSQEARANEPQTGRKAVFVDYDHDNDLDIFIGNDCDFPTAEDYEEAAKIPLPRGSSLFVNTPVITHQSNTLLRNNGNGTFTDQTDEAGLLVEPTATHDAVIADFDGDNDIDLFTADSEYTNPLVPLSKLFANQRMGKMKVGGVFTPALREGASSAVEGDFNHDGKPDLIVELGSRPYLYQNEGGLRFHGERIAKPWDRTVQGLHLIEVFDYNNDGWSDLLLASRYYGGTLGLSAGSGPGTFAGVTENVGFDGKFGAISGLATGDLDGDGDLDIVLSTSDRGPIILKNETATPENWIDVRLVGKKVNRSGYGSTVEVASGGHYQKQVYSEGQVHFGIGNLKSIDVVRVTWPNGVAQNVIRPEINKVLTIEERVKVSASCGFLYAHNGHGFELINEILGVGPLGVPMAPGVYHQPDSTELTKIEAHQLIPKDGFYDLRLTEELREMMYADKITLRVMDHPSEIEIIPNEMFTAPPFPEDKYFAVSDHRPPVAAVDNKGVDVLPQILSRDGASPTFSLTQYDGLADSHSLTLDLGDLSGAKQITLFLDGWIYWSDSSTVMAISQDPRFAFAPLTLEVVDAAGQWHTAIESVGLPTSKGIVVPVDLTGRFLCDDYRVRLSTNMCIYFDRIFTSTKDEAARCRVTELPVARADLHYRGFSRMTRDALGFERFNYADVSPTGSWSQSPGMYTKYGDVTPLLADPDNMYVIFGPGDELALRFDAKGLPKLPTGWSRDFVFYANGWVKDGDLNTKFSESVAPLPFHGMTGYPYPNSEEYPDTPQLRRYRETYNTRPGKFTVGLLPSSTPNR